MNKNLYLVSVVRGGKRRTATMTAAEPVDDKESR